MPQRLRSIPDSGSSELVVLGSHASCLSSEGYTRKCNSLRPTGRAYDPSDSSTANVSNVEVNLEYGSGPVYGVLGTDAITVGDTGYELSTKTNDQQMIIMTEVRAPRPPAPNATPSRARFPPWLAPVWMAPLSPQAHPLNMPLKE